MILSVLVPTYRQENYIKQCLISILNQKIDFDLEILVGDDCSPDNTVGVIEALAKSDSRIKLYQWNPNEGGLKNIDKLLTVAQGEYIAILEGDDYWLDPLHLSKAVSILKDRPNVSFVAANYLHQMDDNLLPMQKLRARRQKNLKFWHLALGNFLQMGTIVYRRSLYSRVPQDYIDLPLGDYPLVLSLLSNGGGLYLPHTAMAYRVHAEGIWSGQSAKFQSEKTITTLNRVSKTLETKLSQRFMISCYLSHLKMQISGRRQILSFWFIAYALLYNYRKWNFI